MKTLLLLTVLALSLSHLLAQHVVSGKTVDHTGTPLPGVAIMEVGTTNGTVTNGDGEFQLTVSNKNTTIATSFVGFRQQRISLNGRTYIEVTLKEDCNVCFFDGKEIRLYLKSGVLNNPLGGEFRMSFPAHRQTIFLSKVSYLSNFSENQFFTGEFGLMHVIVECDEQVDINSRYRRITWNEDREFKSFMVEGYLHLSNFIIFPNYTSLTFGYGQSDLIRKRESPTVSHQPGFLAGIATSIGHPLRIEVSGQTIYWKNFWEFQADIKRRFKRVAVSAQFLKVHSFTEVTLAAGFRFNY